MRSDENPEDEQGAFKLISHITIDHPCWRDGFKKFQKQNSMEISFTSQKGHDIYRCLERIIGFIR